MPMSIHAAVAARSSRRRKRLRNPVMQLSPVCFFMRTKTNDRSFLRDSFFCALRGVTIGTYPGTQSGKHEKRKIHRILRHAS
jgi:hypothetical protein